MIEVKEFLKLLAPRRSANDDGKYVLFVKGDMFLLLSKSMNVVYGPEADANTYQFDSKTAAWLAAAYYYSLWGKPYPYIEEVVEVLEASPFEFETDRHMWKCISVGLYDNLYECKKCKKKHMESIDNPDTTLPVHGCGED